MGEEKLAAVKEVERLKTEVDRVRNEMQLRFFFFWYSSRRLLRGGGGQGREKTGPLNQPGADADGGPPDTGAARIVRLSPFGVTGQVGW